MSLSDFVQLRKLGDGAFSSVYQVRRRKDSCIYALKRVSVTRLSDKDKGNALNEVRLLASIHHPNVISYREAFIDPQSDDLW